jgi:tRNA-dihydrouridine synthase
VAGLTIPVIANGDLYFPEHVAAVRTAANDPRLAVMLARPALYNPSVFRALKGQGQTLPLDEAMRDYLKLCLRYENHVSNTKYNLMEIMCRKRHPDHLKVNCVCWMIGTLDHRSN